VFRREFMFAGCDDGNVVVAQRVVYHRMANNSVELVTRITSNEPKRVIYNLLFSCFNNEALSHNFSEGAGCQEINSFGWYNDTVKNSSITTKHLYLILTFRSHHEIFIRRSWYSVLPGQDG